MMPKKLLIHIGPPKTATTSLQYWLQKNQYKYTYLGIIQPRKPKHNIIYNKFWLFINKKINCKELIDFLDGIKTEKVLIFSEEMILTNDWLSKLNRLEELKNYFDLYLAYCYRPTKKVIPSYYAEIHTSLPIEMKKNYELFLQDNRVGAFDLERVCEVIESKRMNLNIFKFEELIKGNLSLNTLFNLSIDDENFRKKIEITKENIRLKKSDNIFQVVDKNPSYPSKLKPFLKKIEKEFNINFKRLFQRNYHIEIRNSKFVDILNDKNEFFLKKLEDAK